MKKILLPLICCIGLLSFSASAQWVPVNHLVGTVAYAGINVTVSSVAGNTGGGCGGVYWATTTGSQYTFTFATPVDAIYIECDALDPTEIMQVIVNGSPFPITNCNLNPAPFTNVCSQTNCNIVGGQFINNTGFAICGGIMVFYGPITSFSVSMVSSIPLGPGTTFDFAFVPPGNTIPPSGTSPSSVTAGSNGPLCEGATLNLTATNTYSPYSWTGPAGFTSTLQNPSIPNTTPGMSGDYIVTSVTPCGTFKDTVTVVISAQPGVPVAGSNSPVCENYPINLTAGNVTVGTVAWSGPNAYASNQQNPTIAAAQFANEGNYTVTVTNPGCPSTSATTFVDILPTPLAPITAPVEFCQFSPSPTLTATGQNLLWYTAATGGTGATSAIPSNTTVGVTTYWVSQTVDGCESPRAQLNVTVKPKPAAPIYSGPVHYCVGDPSTTLTVSGTNLQWYDAQNNPIAGAPTPNTSAPADYTWSVDQTLNGCVSDRTVISIHVAAIPPPPVVADVKQCQFDQEVPLTAIGQDLTWYEDATGGALTNTPVPSTSLPMVKTWYVTQTIDGCESPRVPITVTIDFLPTSTFDVSRPLVCENDTLTFWYTGNAGLSEIYTWTLPADSAELISGDTSTPGPLVIRFDSVGTFPLTLNVDNLGCNTTTTYDVKVVTIPHVTISMPENGCVHDSIKVGLGNYNSFIASMTWNFGAGINVMNSINEGPYQIQWNNPGVHRVQVEVSNTACETNSFDTIRIHPAPDARFTTVSGSAQLCVGDSVRLAAVDNNGLYSYEWGPDRFFNHSNNYAPVVNAYVAAAQSISLTVTTPHGCAAIETKLMEAELCCTVSLPNVFTPNGDGKNDIFRPITVGTHAMKMFMIVNRWGQKVFETINESEGWDGTLNGADQKIDTYYYILQYQCNGKLQEQKGEVILLR